MDRILDLEAKLLSKDSLTYSGIMRGGSARPKRQEKSEPEELDPPARVVTDPILGSCSKLKRFMTGESDAL